MNRVLLGILLIIEDYLTGASGEIGVSDTINLYV